MRINLKWNQLLFGIPLLFVISVFYLRYTVHISEASQGSLKASAISHNTDDGHNVYHGPDGIAPCGEVCSYGGTVSDDKNMIYPQWHKHVNCKNIMKRMAFRNHTIIWPPPRNPPNNLLDEFTMHGEMPISQWQYFEQNWTENVKSFSGAMIQTIIDGLHRGRNVNMYKDGICVQNTLKKYLNQIRNKSGVVIGTELPWLEAILLGYGAKNITTLEYAQIKYEWSNMIAYTPYEYANLYLEGKVSKFDFAVSFSSIEHSGLGRYTDPLNPYGDLEAMAQVWCMIKPGGMMAVGVPGELDDSNFIIWNANRVYGTKRLQHLTANWKLIEMTQCADIYHHHFIVLQKPTQQ